MGQTGTYAVMNWTIDKPHVPGWYWFRKSEQENRVLMSLRDFEDKIMAVWPERPSEPVIDMPGEWCGPLEEPT